MWQISKKLSPILPIFGTYYESASQIPCAKCDHSVVSGQPIRHHSNLGTKLTLTATVKKALRFYLLT